jgi:hypothetical protein
MRKGIEKQLLEKVAQNIRFLFLVLPFSKR